MAKKHQGQHEDGSFEAGEGAAEALLEKQLNTPLEAKPREDDGEDIPLLDPIPSGARKPGGACPPSDGINGDKSPEVFEWHCVNSADAVHRYKGRLVAGQLVTEDFINRVRLMGLRDALGSAPTPMPKPSLSDEITEATKQKVKQAQAAEQP